MEHLADDLNRLHVDGGGLEPKVQQIFEWIDQRIPVDNAVVLRVDSRTGHRSWAAISGYGVDNLGPYVMLENFLDDKRNWRVLVPYTWNTATRRFELGAYLLFPGFDFDALQDIQAPWFSGPCGSRKSE